MDGITCKFYQCSFEFLCFRLQCGKFTKLFLIQKCKVELFFSVYFRLNENGEKVKVTQTMVFPDDHPQYPGQPKGARVICMERFGCFSIIDKDLKQLKERLAQEEDFNSSKYLIEEEMEKIGVEVIFFPKFTCEVSFPCLIFIFDSFFSCGFIYLGITN